jgi:putative transposase
MEPDAKNPSLRRQCALLGLNRSTWYAPTPVGDESAENQRVMNRINMIYTDHPFYGSRKLTAVLRREGYRVNRKRVRRLMRAMGLVSIAPKPNTSRPRPQQAVYPYLLRGVVIERPHQVWSTDITYLRIERGWAYLVALIDWHSRYVLAWRLSNTIDTACCVDALTEALEQHGTPEIFNTDQGSQFTSAAFIEVLNHHHIRISMDSKGRALDNIFIERLWRSLKYEEVYLKHYQSLREAQAELSVYFRFYNIDRPHQSLDNRTPEQVYRNVQPHQ